MNSAKQLVKKLGNEGDQVVLCGGDPIGNTEAIVLHVDPDFVVTLGGVVQFSASRRGRTRPHFGF